MSPLFMDTEYQPNRPDSLSAEQSCSSSSRSDREDDGQEMGQRGVKRKEKNRDAARKSRRKQTERADELHEELQCLERSNSALQKEISMLKREFNVYTKCLEKHKSFCLLQDAASNSKTRPGDCPSRSSSPGVAPQASVQAVIPSSVSTSLASSLDFDTLGCIESACPSSSVPAAMTATSASSTSSSYFASSSSFSAPYSGCLSKRAAPHSLFADSPLLFIPSQQTICSASHAAAASPQSKQSGLHEHSAPANTSLNIYSERSDTFLPEQAPANAQLSYSVGVNASLVEQSCPANVAQPNPAPFPGAVSNSDLLCLVPSSALQEPAAHQSPSVSPQGDPGPSSIDSLRITPDHAFSVPPTHSPLSEPLTTSSNIGGSLTVPPMLPPLGPSRDVSLSEFLDENDWIFQ